MILTLTANPALDVTYRVDALRPGQINRVVSVRERPGGKGINVARVLAAHGVDVLALGPAGGVTGEAVRSMLDAVGVAHALTPIAAATRRTVVVAAGPGEAATGADGAGAAGEATGLWEPGPVLSPEEWAAVCASFVAALPSASVAVLSGSLPRGVPVDAYAPLVAAAARAGVPTILDADGDALRHGLSAGPTVAKPNGAELAALVGLPVTGAAGAVAAAQRAREFGARDVVVSLGPDGLVAVTADGVWAAHPARRFDGNATGAGDAAVAALALGLSIGDPWPQRLARAAAWSAAAAASPVAGEADPALVAELVAGVAVSTTEG